MRRLPLFHFDEFGVDHFRGPVRPMQFVHSHCEVEVNFVDKGSVTYQFPGRRVELVAGQLMVFFGVTPHELVTVGEDSLFNWVTVPLPWFLQWRMDERFTAAILRGQIIKSDAGRDRGRARSDKAAFRQWHDDLRSNSRWLRRAAMLEIQARLERLADAWALRESSEEPGPKGTGTGGDRNTLEKVEQMLRFVASNYTAELQSADIAAAAGLHPHYASELFRHVIGMTPMEFLTRQRVAHAQRLLTTTTLKVSDIATQAGFGSQSRFYDVFARALGKSPKQFRDEASG
jgi:AraC family transcriptional regulator, melibiose operon regulatory protein